MIELKSKAEIEKMADAGKILAVHTIAVNSLNALASVFRRIKKREVNVLLPLLFSKS